MSDENKGEVVIYQSEDGLTQIEVKLESETIWLTQDQLVNLYQSSKSNVSEHIKHIFEEGELNRDSVVRNFRTTVSMFFLNCSEFPNSCCRIKLTLVKDIFYMLANIRFT